MCAFIYLFMYNVYLVLCMCVYNVYARKCVCVYIYIYIYIYIHSTGTLAQRLECSPMARETWVQSQVESYQRL